MFYLIYNLFSIFLLIPVILYHLYRSVSRSRPPAFAERFGYLPDRNLALIAGKPVIWLHAVSVGESIAARPLLKALRQRYPSHAIVVSNTTETGRGVASSFPEIDLCIYFPFDFLTAVRRALDLLQPKIVIIMETEIWPNFTREAYLRKIPVVLANGRISDRSFSGYLCFSWFFRNALQLFSRLCMQTDIDRERIVAIGAPAERVITAGNLKYDIPLRQTTLDENRQLRTKYGIPLDAAVITAASTHSGEEQFIICTYQELLKNYPDLFLILVPRHPERSAEVAALLERSGVTSRRRTTLAEAEQLPKGTALLVDTVGEMMNLYGLSDIAYVGGSLVPTGGHNLLEPASLGVPCLFGPHMSNFREIAALVLNYEAGIQINNPRELLAGCQDLLNDPSRRGLLAQNGLKMMAENGGATGKHMEIIAGLL